MTSNKALRAKCAIIAECTPNLFHVIGLFLYPLNISENQKFSDAFRKYRKRPVT